MPAGEDVEGAGSDPARNIHERETVIQGLDSDLGGAQHAAGDSPTPAGVATLDEFSRALVEIGLIGEAEIESFNADSAQGVLGLSRALVKAGKLTPYQAAAVYQKKSRGLLIGNYVILDKLGQGGMGVVFKARHRRLGRVGALKILPPSFARDRTAVMRFRREVEAAGLLKHPNLVAALDADEDRGVHFLVMDYVEGRDLDRIVRERGPMPVGEAVDCLIQAARGLGAAHAQGIVHRDIKPANFMLDAAGTVRVLDLGLARLVDAGNPFNKTARGRLTESGVYMGTIDYMAPEQAEDSHRVDHRADIYSLGCTLHYLLTGQEPFLGATVLKRLMAHMERPAPSLRVARPDVPLALDAAYLKMMAKRPEDRPASMTEVIALLEASKTGPDLSKGTGAAPPKSKPELMVFNEQPLKRAGALRTKSEPSIFARPQEPEGLAVGDELSLEDLVMDVRPEQRPAPLPPAPRPAPAKTQPLKRLAATGSRGRPRRRGLVLLGVGATAALAAAFVGFGLFSGPPRRNNATPREAGNVPDRGTDRRVATAPDPPPGKEITTTAANIPAKPTAPESMALKPTAPEPPKDLKREGVFGFPQAQATVLYDRPDLRVSAWNDASYLYVQAILWKDDRDEYEPKDGGDEGMLILDVDANNKVTPQRDRVYCVWPSIAGLQYLVYLSENTWTGLRNDSKGRGAVRYLDQGRGTRVRVDSFVIPLDEIGRRPSETIRLAYMGTSPHTNVTVNSVAYHRAGTYHFFDLPGTSFHALTLSDRPSTLDVTQVPAGADKPNPTLTEESKPTAPSPPLRANLIRRRAPLITESKPTAPSPPTEKTTTPIALGTRLILARLDQPITMAFPNETSLRDVLKYIQQATKGRNDSGIPVYIDPLGLQEVERTWVSTVRINVDKTPLKITLKQILGQLSLAYVVKDDVLFISSPKGVDRWKHETAVLATDASLPTKAVLAKLDEPISMSFANSIPLDDLLKYIQRATKKLPNDPEIKILVDPRGLQEVEKTLKSTVWADLAGVPLKTTLRLLLKQLGLTYVVKDGSLLITAPRTVRAKRG